MRTIKLLGEIAEVMAAAKTIEVPCRAGTLFTQASAIFDARSPMNVEDSRGTTESKVTRQVRNDGVTTLIEGVRTSGARHSSWNKASGRLPTRLDHGSAGSEGARVLAHTVRPAETRQPLSPLSGRLRRFSQLVDVSSEGRITQAAAARPASGPTDGAGRGDLG